MQPFRYADSERSFLNGQNYISRYFFSQTPKCLFILSQYSNVYLCARFSDPKTTIDEKHALKFGSVSEQGAEISFQKETMYFISTKHKC